jgi:orotidine-5'-phosphate decarboxylase
MNFMDDVCVATDTTPKGYTLHRKIIHEFLDTLGKHSYFLKVLKCLFEQPEIEFLRYVVRDGVA